MQKKMQEGQSPPSDYYDPEIEVESWQLYTDPKEFEFYLKDHWMAPAELYTREIIHKLGLDNDPRVIEADKKILKLAIKLNAAKLDKSDIGYQPEPTWWWYFLNDIHHGKYPLELLPDHLKDIYREHLKNLGKPSS